jgi:hypothetical protein
MNSFAVGCTHVATPNSLFAVGCTSAAIPNSLFAVGYTYAASNNPKSFVLFVFCPLFFKPIFNEIHSFFSFPYFLPGL